jgi:hypothetical protein
MRDGWARPAAIWGAASKVGGNPIEPCVSKLAVNDPDCVRVSESRERRWVGGWSWQA